jgi:hypothetical protein
MTTYQKIEQLYFNTKLVVRDNKGNIDDVAMIILKSKELAFKEVLDIIDADNDFRR